MSLAVDIKFWDVASGFMVCERVAASFLLVFYVTQVIVCQSHVIISWKDCGEKLRNCVIRMTGRGCDRFLSYNSLFGRDLRGSETLRKRGEVQVNKVIPEE